MLIPCPKCGAMRSDRSDHCSTCEAQPLDYSKPSKLRGNSRPDQIDLNTEDNGSLYFKSDVRFEFRGDSPVSAFIETMSNGCCYD